MMSDAQTDAWALLLMPVLYALHLASPGTRMKTEPRASAARVQAAQGSAHCPVSRLAAQRAQTRLVAMRQPGRATRLAWARLLPAPWRNSPDRAASPPVG